MDTVASADGTTIAFDRYGDGPPVIMAVAAFNTRSATDALARALAPQFTVLNYDRRGRGDSGDTTPYAVDREIDDIAALIMAAGGAAALFGYSSGATLALRAAAAGLPITKVALYQTQAVGIPPDVVAQLRHAPFRPGLEAIAHTLAYDAAIIGDLSLPAGLLATVTAPALVISGENSPPFLRNAARAAAAALPGGRLATLPGQTHDINPEATAPVMAEFLAS